MANGHAYPYKKLLSAEVVNVAKDEKYVELSESFLKERDCDGIIQLSDTLVETMTVLLENKTNLTKSILREWWLNL